MLLQRLALALAAGTLSLLAACAAPPSTTPASATSVSTSTAASEPKVTMSDCEEPPLGSRVSRKCPHGQMKAGQAPAAPETTTK